MLKRALAQIKMIETTIIDGFLSDPSLANYGQSNNAMGEEPFDGGDRKNLKSRERHKQQRMMNTKKEMCTANAKRLLSTFIYPLLIMTIRLEIEVIFTMRYEKFFSNIGPSGN